MTIGHRWIGEEADEDLVIALSEGQSIGLGSPTHLKGTHGALRHLAEFTEDVPAGGIGVAEVMMG